MPTPSNMPTRQDRDITSLKRIFVKEYKAILLDYYLSAPLGVWTNQNTQEVLELCKKQIIAYLHETRDLLRVSGDPTTLLSQETLQQYMLHYLTRDIKRLNTQRNLLKNRLEANNSSPQAILAATTAWNKFIEDFTGGLTRKIYVIKSDIVEKFIKNITDTIAHQKSESLSDDNANIINRLYRKSEIEILKAVLTAKKNDPQNVYHTQNARKLFKHLVVYFHKNTNHREGFETSRIIQYLADHYLSSIKALFELTPKELEAKIQNISATRSNAETAVKIMNQYCIEKLDCQDNSEESPKPNKNLSAYANEIVTNICGAFRLPHGKYMTSNHIIDTILDELILNIVPRVIEQADKQSHKYFLELTNSPEKAEIIAELKSVLYKEYRLLILRMLEIVMDAKENNLQRNQAVPPAQIVDAILVPTYIDEKGEKHYIDEPPPPEKPLTQLETKKEKEDPLLKTLREQEEALLGEEKIFIEAIIQAIKEELKANPSYMLYEEYKKKSPPKFEAWYKKTIAPLVEEYRSKLRQQLFPELTDKSQLPPDYTERVEKLIVSAIHSAAFLHDQDVKAGREPQLSPTQTLHSATPKKQRP